jgi:hypothetical protein
MARGVSTIAESQAEAEAQIETEKHEVRILSCREIDLSGLPPLQSGPLPRHWMVVVEDLTPELAAERPQQEDPEGECERNTRQLYLALATDPELLSTGSTEAFPCPSCEEEVRIELPPARERPHPGHFSCPQCRAHLRLAASGSWELAPANEKRDGRCIFCGAKANSKEHVIPEWISKRLGIKQIISMEGSIQSSPNPRRRPISFGSYRAPIFCEDCNTHFKHLEDAVIPLIVPMAKGLAFSLGAQERELLALWSVKTAVSLLSAEPGDQEAVPLEHRKALRERGEFVADTWVGVFRWHGEPVIMSGDGIATNRKNPGLVRETYGAMLAFEGFGFYVTAFKEPIGAGARLCGDRPPMLSIWPPRSGLVHWPVPMTDNRVLPRNLVAGWTPLQDA